AISSPDIIVTLPAITVAVGDLIVVHVRAASATGTITDETTSKTSCTDQTVCYDGAYDVRGNAVSTSGLAFADRVLTVRAPDATIQDAVVFTKSNGSTNSS